MSIEQIESGSFAPNSNDPPVPNILRIVSWNIARGCKLNAIEEFLGDTNPDLLLLQEVDRNARRSGYKNVARELSEKLQLNYAFGIEFQELSQGCHLVSAFHGQATLSPWPLSTGRVLRFGPQSRFWCPHRWVPNFALFQRRHGGRMALVTEVAIGPMQLLAYNLHLESRDGDDLRNRQLSEVLEDVVRHCGFPTIVAGDFNFDLTRMPQSDEVARAGLRNPFAGGELKSTLSSSTGKGRAIDCILTSREFQSVSAEVVSSVDASDHYPLSLTVILDKDL